MSINQAKIGFLGLYLTTPSHNKREESPYSEPQLNTNSGPILIDLELYTTKGINHPKFIFVNLINPYSILLLLNF